MNSSRRYPAFLKELVRDWNTLQSLSGKQKLRFVWDYYKWRILASVCAVTALFLAALILWQGQKPCRLRVCVVLNTEADCEDWFDSFTKKLQSDGEPGAVDVNFDQLFDYDSPYYYIQEIEVMTTISSGRMDVAVCNEDLYRYLLARNACLPLSGGLPEDLYTSLLENGKLIYDTANLTADENGYVDPADGINGYYAVDLSGTEFYELYNQTGSDSTPLYAVIISNTEHLKECGALIGSLCGISACLWHIPLVQ